MPALQVITVQNVGKTFKASHVDQHKIDVNVDQDTLVVNEDGTISVNIDSETIQNLFDFEDLYTPNRGSLI